MPEFIVNRTAVVPELREERVAGRRFVVAPAVLAVPGVLNGEMVELAELARAARTGNGAPIVIRHPKGDDGRPVSANSPHIGNIGHLYNLSAAGDRLRGEAWIDVDLASLTDDGRDVLRRVQTGEILENSLGWWRDSQPSDQADFSAYARNIVIDHYAILPDEPGACSVNDGCGIPRVNSQDAGGGNAAAGGSAAPSWGERIMERLNTILERIMSTNSSNDRDALIQRLAAAENIGLTAEQLGGLGDDVLAAFDRASTVAAPATVAANSSNAAPQAAGEGVDGQPAAEGNGELEALRATVAQLTEQMSALTANAAEQRQTARQERIAELAANSAVAFTAEELEGFSDEQLGVLAGKLRPARFGGRPAPGSLSTNNDDGGQIIDMPMPVFKQA